MSTKYPTRPVPYPAFDGTQACLDVGSDVFFPKTQSEVHRLGAAAKQVCTGCGFRLACREWAISHDVVGIWGGTTARERRRIRAELGVSAIPVSESDTDAVRRRLAELDTGRYSANELARIVGCSAKTIERFRLRRATEQEVA